jgi:predicted RNA-binding Zn-ribbon protein involved in translation (DUF1610 family)
MPDGGFDWDTFLNLLTSRGVSDECPACGHAQWGHGDHIVGLLLADENQNIEPQGGIAAVPLACTNCGYLRMFVPAAIDGDAPTDTG